MAWARALVEDKHSKRRLFPNVRNKRLLDLGVLYFAFLYDHYREPSKSIRQRAWVKGIHANGNSGIVSELQPSDVQAVLGCSVAKAKEYIQVLRVLCMNS